MYIYIDLHEGFFLQVSEKVLYNECINYRIAQPYMLHGNLMIQPLCSLNHGFHEITAVLAMVIFISAVVAYSLWAVVRQGGGAVAVSRRIKISPMCQL